MTLRQQAEQAFNVEPQVLVAHVHRLLAENKEYRSQSENSDSTIFTTQVKPFVPGVDWLLLGTRMTIAIHRNGQMTRVVATTESQPFILGDAFAMYERYIRDFFAKLRLSLEKGGDPTDIIG